MNTVTVAELQRCGPDADHLTVALANISWFRALACRALRDGSPQGLLRAANARAAAHIVLRQARRDALANRRVTDALAVGR